MDNKEFTLTEFEKLKGQFVICDSHVYRFIGIAEDGFDFMFILWNGREITRRTILDSLIELKGKIDNKSYDEFVRLAKLNDYDCVLKDTKDIEEKIMKILSWSKAKLMKDLCWNIN